MKLPHVVSAQYSFEYHWCRSEFFLISIGLIGGPNNQSRSLSGCTQTDGMDSWPRWRRGCHRLVHATNQHPPDSVGGPASRGRRARAAAQEPLAICQGWHSYGLSTDGSRSISMSLTILFYCVVRVMVDLGLERASISYRALATRGQMPTAGSRPPGDAQRDLAQRRIPAIEPIVKPGPREHAWSVLLLVNAGMTWTRDSHLLLHRRGYWISQSNRVAPLETPLGETRSKREFLPSDFLQC